MRLEKKIREIDSRRLKNDDRIERNEKWIIIMKERRYTGESFEAAQASLQCGLLLSVGRTFRQHVPPDRSCVFSRSRETQFDIYKEILPVSSSV